MQKILPNNTLSKFYPWNALVDHQKRIATTSIKDHFKKEPNRLEYTWLEWEDFRVDVSKNRIDKTGFELLLKLADKSGLKAAIEAQFTGQPDQRFVPTCWTERVAFSCVTASSFHRQDRFFDSIAVSPAAFTTGSP